MMKDFFNKPYPFYERKNEKLLSSFFYAAFVYIFLITFQPFGISEIPNNKFLIVFGYFGVTFIILIINFMLSPLMFKRFFNPDNWTIGKNIIFSIFQFLLISVFNWLYNLYVDHGITPVSLLTFVFYTLAVGILPKIFLIFYFEKKLSIQNKTKAKKIKDKYIASKTAQSITIESKNKGESIKISIDKLICIKAEGNYLNVCFIEGDNSKSQIIRNTIAEIENQLKGYTNIKRCHRSYLVNFDKIENISGNARSLNLHFSSLDHSIPVSRSLANKIIEELKTEI